MKSSLALFIIVFYFGSAVAGLAQDFSYTSPYGPGNELNYMSSDYSTYYPPAYWPYPYVPAKCQVQAAKERLWANKYLNPNSVKWQVQATKERLWMVRHACPTCWQEQEYAWTDHNSLWERKYSRMGGAGEERNRIQGDDRFDMEVPSTWEIERRLGNDLS